MQSKQKEKTIAMQLKSGRGLPLWLQWLVNRMKHTTSSPIPHSPSTFVVSFCGSAGEAKKVAPVTCLKHFTDFPLPTVFCFNFVFQGSSHVPRYFCRRIAAAY